MIRFEIKKVFSKSMNKIVLLFLIAILVVFSILAINKVEYIDKNGNSHYGITAARNLKEEKNKWSGHITEDVLEKVVEENAKVNHSEQASSEDIQEQNKAYAKKQGFSDISGLINSAFSEWRDFNDFAIDSVSPEDGTKVYERRISNLKNYFESGGETFTDSQKNYLITQYESLDTPFYYEYMDGWKVLLQDISTFLLILALVIGFFVSGIFSYEFQLKADSIFFSSKLGRNKAVSSKVGAGFLITTVFYVIFVALYTLIVLLALGTDGANCPVQLDLWRSSYDITFFQAYLLIVAGGYVGTLLAAILSMLVSAITHSTVISISIPFIVLCVSPILSRIITLPQICSFFPDQLLEIYLSIKEFSLVELGGRVVNVATVIILVYMAVCLLLLPILHNVYKKAEIK